MRPQPLLLLALLLLAAPRPGLGDAPLLVSNEINVNGIFDPSVEYDASGAVGWLAYSSIYGTILPWGANVETGLAKSLDAWRDKIGANAPTRER